MKEGESGICVQDAEDNLKNVMEIEHGSSTLRIQTRILVRGSKTWDVDST